MSTCNKSSHTLLYHVIRINQANLTLPVTHQTRRNTQQNYLSCNSCRISVTCLASDINRMTHAWLLALKPFGGKLGWYFVQSGVSWMANLLRKRLLRQMCIQFMIHSFNIKSLSESLIYTGIIMIHFNHLLPLEIIYSCWALWIWSSKLSWLQSEKGKGKQREQWPLNGKQSEFVKSD